MKEKMSVYVLSAFIVLCKSGFVCVTLDVFIHQRKRGPLSLPKPPEKIFCPPLLTNCSQPVLSVGRRKFGAEFLTTKTNEPTQAHN